MPVCYVSAPRGASSAAVSAILNERGVTVTQVDRESNVSAVVLRTHIARADFIVIVATAADFSANAGFEAGIAAALGKPVLIVAEPGMTLPTFLRGFHVIPADSGRGALSFVIDQLKGLPTRKAKSRLPRAEGGAPLGAKADKLLVRFENALGDRSGAGLEGLVEDLLRMSGVKVIAHQSAEENPEPDFAVWLEGLDDILGNPSLVEVKRQVRQISGSVLRSIDDWIAHTNARSALVFYAEGPPSTARSAADAPVLFIRIGELIEDLRRTGLAGALRAVRNSAVHGGEER